MSLACQDPLESSMQALLQRTVGRVLKEEPPDGTSPLKAFFWRAFPTVPTHEPKHELGEIHPLSNGHVESNVQSHETNESAPVPAPTTQGPVAPAPTTTAPTTQDLRTGSAQLNGHLNGVLTPATTRIPTANGTVPEVAEASTSQTVEPPEPPEPPSRTADTAEPPPVPATGTLTLASEAVRHPSVQCLIKSGDVRMCKSYATRRLYIGTSKIEIPSDIIQSWESDKREQLKIDLADVISDIRRKAADRKSKESESNVVCEIRMSGYAARGSLTVTLEPCLWILCGSKWAANMIKEKVKDYTWIQSFVPGPVQVHGRGAVWGTSSESELDITGLNFSYGIEIADDVILYINVEDYSEKSSLCGLLCCATIQHGTKTVHRFCRIGGVISIGTNDGVREQFGLSTAHSMLNNPDFLRMIALAGVTELSSDAWSRRVENEQDVNGSVSEDDDDEDEEESEYGSNESEGLDIWNDLPQEQRLGYRDPTAVMQWNNTDYQRLSYLGRTISSQPFWTQRAIEHQQSSGSTDHALLRFDKMLQQLSVPLGNTYYQKDGVVLDEATSVKGHARDDELEEGPVVIVCTPDSTVEGYLLAGSTDFVAGGETFTLRKIETTAVLARGTSGSWVVKDGVLYGMILAIFETEPYALMMTAARVLDNIRADNPYIEHVDLSTTHETARSEPKRTDKYLPVNGAPIGRISSHDNATRNDDLNPTAAPATREDVQIYSGIRLRRDSQPAMMDDDDIDSALAEDYERVGIGKGVLTRVPKKRLGYFDIVCLVINFMIGTGIFQSQSRVIQGTGSIGGSLVLWGVGIIYCLCGAHVYVELGLSLPHYTINGVDRSVPRNGGELNYLHYIYHKPAYRKTNITLSTCLFAIGFIAFGNMAGSAINFAVSLLRATGIEDPNNGAVRGIAIAAALLICLVQVFSRRYGILLNNIFAVAKICMMLVIIIIAIMVGAGGLPRTESVLIANTDTSTSFQADNATATGYSHAFLAIVFSFWGFTQPNYILGEIARPKRKFPIAVSISVVLVCTIYMAVIICYMVIVPKDIQINGEGSIGQQFFEMTLGRLEPGYQGRRILNAFLAVSSFGNMVVITYTATRVKQEMAKEGILPFAKTIAQNYALPLHGLFLRLHRNRWPRWFANLLIWRISYRKVDKTPMAAIGVHFLICLILIAATSSVAPDDAFHILSTLGVYVVNCFFGFSMGLGILLLRLDWWPRRKSNNDQGYSPAWSKMTHSRGTNKVVVSVVTASIFTAGNAWLVIAMFVPSDASTPLPGWLLATIALSVLAFGVCWFLGFPAITYIKYHKKRKILVVERRPEFEQDMNGEELVLARETTYIDWVWADTRVRYRGRGGVPEELDASFPR